MRVIECSGTPYEIGKQIGEGCGDILHHSMKTTFAVLSRGYGNSTDEVIATASKFIEPVREYDHILIEHLQGQADAIAVPFEEMFALRCIFEMSYYYKQIQGLCTSFAATGKATRDGKTILGQNIDWLTTYEPYLLHMHYEDGTRLLALSLGGMVEYSMNSYGFGNCANSLFTKADPYCFSLPLGCYLPKVMRQSSIDEAAKLLKQVARGVGYFHLADRTGNMVGIESTFEEVEAVHPSNELLFHANCYCTERFKDRDMAAAILPDAFDRTKRIEELLLAQHGNISVDTAKTILSDHAHSPYSICRHGAPNKPTAWEMTTVASFIMVPEEGKMYIAKGSPCENDYVEYTV